MACRTAVLTEANGEGVTDLFEDGKQVITYSAENLLERVAWYLDHDEEREAISSAGSERISRCHTTTQRAKQLLELLKNSVRTKKRKAAVMNSLGQTLLNYFLKWQDKDRQALNDAFNLINESLSVERTADGLITAGLILTLTGQHENALKYFKSAKIQFPDEQISYLYSGVSQYYLSDMPGAKLSLAKFLQSEKDTGGAPGTEAFYSTLGDLLRENGNDFEPGLMKSSLPMHFWSALEYYIKAAEIKPDNWEVVGDMLMEVNSPDQALKAYDAAGVTPLEKLIRARKASYY